MSHPSAARADMNKPHIANTIATRSEEADDILVPRRCTLNGFAEETAQRKGLHLARLEALTRLEVRTRNTLYRMTVVEPNEWKVLVRGGRFFPRDTPAYLCGSGYGGALLRVAWIGVGLCCEFSAGGARVVTSPVSDFRVVDSPPLPGPF